MHPETPFRLALLLVMVTTMGLTISFRLQAAASGERISHRAEGYLFAAVLRLAGIALWIATFGYLLFPDRFRWAHLPVPDLVRWLAVAIGMLCPWLFYWTLSSLGKNLTDTVVTRQNATLVTVGPYRYVRHPFYLSVALIMGSVSIFTANGLILGASLLILSMLTIRTPKEESMLIERFGDDYRRYMATTPRYLPAIRRHKIQP